MVELFFPPLKNMKKTKVKILTAVIAFLIFLVIVIIAIFCLNYFFNKNNPVSRVANKILPFPVAWVGKNDLVTIKKVEENLSAVKNFYENQDFSAQGLRVDFSTEDGKRRLAIKEKDVLNKIIEDEIIEKLANEKGIKITDEMVSQEIERILSREGDEKQAEENLIKLYGWDIENFKERVALPEMYKEKLAEKIYAETDFESYRKKIEEAQLKLKNKNNFEEVAKEFSDGQSASSGGDLGWFTYKQIVPEVAEKVFSMEKGKISEVIQSQLGFHIVMLEDKKEESGSQKVKIKQIFFRAPSFADWFLKEGKKIPVKIFLADYFWNQEKMRLEFKNEELKKFEENLMENSQGDASVFF